MVQVGFNVLEIAAFDEAFFLLVVLRVHVIYLDLVEGVVSHATSVDDESTLSKIYLNLISIDTSIIKITANTILMSKWEDWFRLSNNLTRLEPTLIVYFNDSPIIETTFPELTKIDIHLKTIFVPLNHISFCNFMPRNNILMRSRGGRRSTQTKIQLRDGVAVPLSDIDVDLNDEVLSNCSDSRSKGFLQLPIDTIVQHI